MDFSAVLLSLVEDVRLMLQLGAVVTGVSAVIAIDSMVRGDAIRRAVGAWVFAATSASAVGLSILAARNYLPDWVTVVVANSLLVAAMAALREALGQLFRDWEVDRWLAWGMAATMVPIFMYYTYVDPDVAPRTVTISLFFAAGTAIAARVAIQRRVRVTRLALLALIVPCAIVGIYMFVRAGVMMNMGRVTNFMRPALIHSLAVILFWLYMSWMGVVCLWIEPRGRISPAVGTLDP